MCCTSLLWYVPESRNHGNVFYKKCGINSEKWVFLWGRCVFLLNWACGQCRRSHHMPPVPVATCGGASSCEAFVANLLAPLAPFEWFSTALTVCLLLRSVSYQRAVMPKSIRPGHVSPINISHPGSRPFHLIWETAQSFFRWCSFPNTTSSPRVYLKSMILSACPFRQALASRG